MLLSRIVEKHWPNDPPTTLREAINKIETGEQYAAVKGLIDYISETYDISPQDRVRLIELAKERAIK